MIDGCVGEGHIRYVQELDTDKCRVGRVLQT